MTQSENANSAAGAMKNRYLTSERAAVAVGLDKDRIEPIAWLVIQELAYGKEPADIAKGLGISEEDLNGLAIATTDESEGLAGQLWNALVVLCRATTNMNLNTVAVGWDSLEAMAVHRLAELIQAGGATMSPKDALAIANAANKATRRHNGEGQSRTSLTVMNRSGNGGGDMSLELKGGHLGSIKLSLSTRIQQQLATPRVIDGESRAVDRRMLSLDETREVVNAK